MPGTVKTMLRRGRIYEGGDTFSGSRLRIICFLDLCIKLYRWESEDHGGFYGNVFDIRFRETTTERRWLNVRRGMHDPDCHAAATLSLWTGVSTCRSRPSRRCRVIDSSSQLQASHPSIYSLLIFPSHAGRTTRSVSSDVTVIPRACKALEPSPYDLPLPLRYTACDESDAPLKLARRKSSRPMC